MVFPNAIRQGLNTALNEATFLNLRVNREQESVDLLFSILTLPPSGPEPSDPRIMSDAVRSFGGVPIYGAGFFDSSEGSWSRWSDRLSVDETLGEGAREHWIDLLKGGDTARHLDLRIWFDDFTIYDMERRIVSTDDFIHAGDERVQGHGIGVFRSD